MMAPMFDPPSAHAFREALRREALALGFAQAGFAAPDDLDPERHFERWIANDRHGAMDYLARGAPRRAAPVDLLPSVRTLLVVAAEYAPAAAADSIAAYARARDYHHEMKRSLDALLDVARALAGPAAAVEGLSCVDTKPLLERAAAARAGLGWIGKNTLLLDEERGPWQMLGVLLLSIELPPDVPAKDRCGTCARCLDACPTNAFVAPYVLDARRCLSYWSIEHRGPWPREFRDALGGRVFGCDDCLIACPFPRRDSAAAGGPSPLLASQPELAALDPREVLRRCEEGFTRHFKRFAIERAGKAGLIRNAITALGNVGDGDDVARLVPYLEHPDRGVRIHAAYALGKLRRFAPAAVNAVLMASRDAEYDGEVRDEIDIALA
jgi:epoxyqueuosine reductase